MSRINESYERDLDLNLLRVFVVVAEAGSVTEAAGRLYLTQPAVSAALKRLSSALGTALFVREGRHLVLSERGRQLLDEARPHLDALAQAARAAPAFTPQSSNRTLRIGLSDALETWLLPSLLAALRKQAPQMRIIALPVQFRTVSEALASGRVDLAITVADEVPSSVVRTTLFHERFVVLFDPSEVRLGSAPSLARYLAQQHVVVSYNGDLRGLVEDITPHRRDVRCSVASFSAIGAIVDGSPLLATVPQSVARSLRQQRPHLRTARLPLEHQGAPLELLARSSSLGDGAVRFVHDLLITLAAPMARAT